MIDFVSIFAGHKKPVAKKEFYALLNLQ